jgi:hypothetical protein
MLNGRVVGYPVAFPSSPRPIVFPTRVTVMAKNVVQQSSSIGSLRALSPSGLRIDHSGKKPAVCIVTTIHKIYARRSIAMVGARNARRVLVDAMFKGKMLKSPLLRERRRAFREGATT